MTIKDEWTQQEYLLALDEKKHNILLIDTILNPIDGAQTVTYNPIELAKEPEGSIFVFYCDTGKASKERLQEYKKKFPKHHCISLKGGRGYWRKFLRADTL